MKTFVLGLCLNFLAFGLAAQNFAPTGASWYYGERVAFGPQVGCFHFESIGDTVILGKNCKRIYKNSDLLCELRAAHWEFMYETGDSIFRYDPYQNNFQLIYNFSAGVGDTWQFAISDQQGDLDSVNVVVDSVDNVLINGILLKRMYHTAYIQFDDTMPYSTQVFEATERIGSPYFIMYWASENFGLCDANFSTGLRCYQDPTLGFYDADTSMACDYTYTGLTETPNATQWAIYPNPTSDVLFVGMMTCEYELFDTKGQKIIFARTADGIISVGNLPRGIYYLRCRAAESDDWMGQPFVKQ